MDREGTPYLLGLLHAPGVNRNGACQDEGNTSMEQLLINVAADILFADLVTMSAFTPVDSTWTSIANRVVMTLRKQYKEARSEGIIICTMARNCSSLSCVIFDLNGNLKVCFPPCTQV